jgi:ATP adenylyltransferase
VANHRIWAPWRLKYVKGAKDNAGGECIFCAKPGEGPEHDQENLIVHRGERCYVILNRFPYTNGHLMIAHTLTWRPFPGWMLTRWRR